MALFPMHLPTKKWHRIGTVLLHRKTAIGKDNGKFTSIPFVIEKRAISIGVPTIPMIFLLLMFVVTSQLHGLGL